jgi:hypothetical protein
MQRFGKNDFVHDYALLMCARAIPTTAPFNIIGSIMETLSMPTFRHPDGDQGLESGFRKVFQKLLVNY